jgi:hypothetical protein
MIPSRKKASASSGYTRGEARPEASRAPTRSDFSMPEGSFEIGRDPREKPGANTYFWVDGEMSQQDRRVAR